MADLYQNIAGNVMFSKGITGAVRAVIVDADMLGTLESIYSGEGACCNTAVANVGQSRRGTTHEGGSPQAIMSALFKARFGSTLAPAP